MEGGDFDHIIDKIAHTVVPLEAVEGAVMG